MEIIRISAEEYTQNVKETFFYFTSSFLEMNSYKIDELFYLIGRDKKNRFAFALGLKDHWLLAPYSAPFSSVIPLRKNVTIEQYWLFFNALKSYAKELGVVGIKIYLPADIYDTQNNVKITNALLGNGFSISYQDINYTFNLSKLNLSSYEDILHHNARKSLRIALNSDLKFEMCDSTDSKKQAYEIIKINRESRGFPLRMSLEQVMSTIKLVDHRFFLVKHLDSDIAAAIVFHVTKDIAQVIYWGNIPDVSELKPINFLSYSLIKYYKDINYRYLDIGISTEEGIPNYGLCNFKDSIGCEVSNKIKFEIVL